MKWESLSLDARILSAIKDDFMFSELTPVQQHCIPLFLTCKDVAVEAVTGSGKTLAFAVPMINKLLHVSATKGNDNSVIGIVISPTQELAMQTFQVYQKFERSIPNLRIMLMIGSVNHPEEDKRTFLTTPANVIIATPGRFAKSLSWLSVYIKSLEMLVLDEADLLLRMGFKNTLTEILMALPRQRRTGLFSATQTDQVEDLIRAGLRNPYRVTVKQKLNKEHRVQKTPLELNNFYLSPPADQKLNTLLSFIRSKSKGKTIVFLSTCSSVEYFGKIIKTIFKNTQVFCLHGKMKKMRESIFSNFKGVDRGILVCTSVLARGIDIPEVEWVIQFDAPKEPEEFVHRCGRTARMGKEGNALLFLSPNELPYIDFLRVNQRAPLSSYEADFPVVDSRLKIRRMASKDRDLYEKGLRAFVSFLQFYKKHMCSAIFVLKELDIGALAKSFCLLHLPAMPELKDRAIDFDKFDIDSSKIPYTNKIREASRLKRLEQCPKPVTFSKNKNQSDSWSKAKEKKIKKEKRRQKKSRVIKEAI